MSIKKYALWFVGATIAVGTLVASWETHRAQMRKERHWEAYWEDHYSSLAFAECAAQMLSEQGLRQAVIHHYRPNGVLWKSSSAAYANPNFPPLPPSDLTNVFSKDHTPSTGLDWPGFAGLKERCLKPDQLLIMSGQWRSMFWGSMTLQPAYKTAMAAVREEDEAILAPWREKARKEQAERDAARKEKEDVLFNDPK